MDERLYRSLARRGQLVKLDISAHGLDIHPLEQPYDFPSLQFLTLRGSLQKLTNVFPTLLACSLLIVSIEVQDDSSRPEGDYGSLFHALQFPSLQRLAVYSTFMGPGSHPVSAKDTFPFLSHLVELRLFSLHINAETPTVEDAAIASIAPYWTRLERLFITGITALAALPTTQSLALMARHCPALMTLILTIDPTTAPSTEIPLSNHGLETLDLHRTLIPYEIAARFVNNLRRLFPCADFVGGNWP
ncbi:hypothetical protein OE88DRAFT_472924 [Heliocybe sulcata]|uniref:F-box domain-containing protein n=1 Tax=Heliocybe sulcata TaxID=5364 RepID=A0A5C3MVJ3_9AGAM|nr:hypothetical protein OE88DRAFT_472924 [Heliocybe sulcata]